MAQFRVIFAGVCLLFLHCAVDASAIREMFIDDGGEVLAGESREEVPTEHALVTSLADNDLDIAEISRDEDVGESEADIDDVDRWWGNKQIAFSAYLSADKHLGKNQHIKFDQVLLNDGNGYEASTGIFRAPVSGVYSFTFVIAQRHSHEIRVNLVVDGKVVLGGIAEGMKRWHDVQGTNTVNVHVCKGKPVWIESYSGGLLEGNRGNYRYTSFSGHILYERK